MLYQSLADPDGGDPVQAIEYPGSVSASSTLHLSSDGISIHMRIPSQETYLPNAIATLREICHHLGLNNEYAFRVMLPFEECLLNVIEHAYPDDCGLIDLQFTVNGSELVIVVEDYGVGLPAHLQHPLPKDTTGKLRLLQQKGESDLMRVRGRGLMIIRGLPSQTLLQNRAEKGTRTTMVFILPTQEAM